MLRLVLFPVSIGLGAYGISKMIAGAQRIRLKDPMGASDMHLRGVIYLTLSAVLTAVNIGDYTYALMQPPFIMATVASYLLQRRVPTKRQRILLPAFTWWDLMCAVAINITLIVVGLMLGRIADITAVIQVVGAAVVSCALCVADARRQRKLFYLTCGRALLCVASFVKCWQSINSEPPYVTNAAAVVWFILMAWGAYQTGREFARVWQQEML